MQHCDLYTRTGTSVRTVRHEDAPTHPFHHMIPAVFICKLITLLSISTAPSTPFPLSQLPVLRPGALRSSEATTVQYSTWGVLDVEKVISHQPSYIREPKLKILHHNDVSTMGRKHLTGVL